VVTDTELLNKLPAQVSQQSRGREHRSTSQFVVETVQAVMCSRMDYVQLPCQLVVPYRDGRGSNYPGRFVWGRRLATRCCKSRADPSLAISGAEVDNAFSCPTVALITDVSVSTVRNVCAYLNPSPIPSGTRLRIESRVAPYGKFDGLL